MSKFKLPAEWAPHEAMWIAWPYNKSDWPGKLSPIQFVYAEIVKYVSRGEKVRIFVQSKENKFKAEKVLKDSNIDLFNIEFFIKKTNRGWLRDSGPMFVNDGYEPVVIDLNLMHGQSTMIINWMTKFLISFLKNLI